MLVRDLSRQRCARLLHGKIDVMVAGTVARRLALFLLNLVDRFGDELEGGDTVIPFGLSRQQITTYIDARVETVIRALSVWKKSGVVTIQWRLAQGTWVLPVKELGRALDAGWPLQEIVKQTSRPPLIDAGQKLIAQIIDHRSTLALSSERQPACGDPTCQ